MFGTKNKREVTRILCRLMSRSAAERLDARGEARSCQVLPVLLGPESFGDPVSGKAVSGLITDLSSGGLGVYVQHILQADRLFIGMRLDEDVHVLRGRVASHQFAGGGFYRLGLELLEVMPPSRARALETFRALTAGLYTPQWFSGVACADPLAAEIAPPGYSV